MGLLPEIQTILAAYDGKNVEPFRRAARMIDPTLENVNELIDMTIDDRDALEIGCTWVIKNLLEHGVKPDSQISSRLLSLIEVMRNNDSVLHLLQMIPYLVIQEKLQKKLYKILKKLLSVDHKFVRAWTYNALGELASINEDYKNEVSELFSDAMNAEPASVQARIRHAVKKMR